jgi:hypothetical protein
MKAQRVRLSAVLLSIALAIALVLPVTLAPPVYSAPEDAPIAGETIEGVRGVTESMASINARQMMYDAMGGRILREQEDQDEREEKVDRTSLMQNPEAPQSAAMVDGRPAELPAEKSALASQLTVSTNFTGATLSGVNPTLAFPPDSMGAVGPTQYMVFVNGRLVTFNKNTGVADGVMNADPDVFFVPVMTGGSYTSDARVRYDRLTGRWFLVMIDVATPNRIMFAVSDAGSANAITVATTWTFFAITSAAGCLSDYPTLGIDANALYVGTNNFCGGGTTYSGADGYVIRKSSIMGAGPIVSTRFVVVASAAAAGPYTPQGVDNYDPSANEGYFIGCDNAAYGLLQLRRVFNPGGTPTISANIPITVSSTTAPVPVPHLGNTAGNNGRLDGLDDRLFAAHIRNGRLWTAHNIQVNASGVASGSGGRNGTRWYELNGVRTVDNGGAPVVVQSGTIFDTAASSPLSYWIPSVMVSGQGHAAFGFSHAGTAAYANAAVTGRLVGDALSATQTVQKYTAATTAYNPASDPGGTGGRRWGDYSYTSLDPLDDMTMWTVQEFCNAANSYGVRVAKLLAPPPATPSVLADVNAGTATVNVTLTGLSTSGSGFYDPGTNLAGVPAFNHLSAGITNGGATGTPPTVVSATYVNPTTVNLVLNAGAATANLPGEKYTLTITNPDGQTAAAAVVRVIGAAAPPTATIATGPTAAEGNAGSTPFTFTVNLSAASGSSVSVNWATADGTATTADGDYVAGSGTLTIPAGGTSGTVNVVVSGDTRYEGNETFTVTISSPVNATLGATTSATGTITNDDTAPTISIAAVSQAEGNSGATAYGFTATLSAASGLAASANYTTANGTATVADGDYTAASGTINFPAGTTTQPITVNVAGDVKYETDESFAVNLSTLSGISSVTTQGVGTITNDDTAPTVALDNVTVAEGNSGTTAFTFTATLSAASGTIATADYATSDGTATTADGDYAAATGTVTFAAGTTTQNVTVNVAGDTKYEGDDAFALALSNLAGISSVTAQGTGTITNDDTAPTVAIDAVSHAEGDSGTTEYLFTATLSAASGLVASADYTTVDGTATVADSDYAAANGTITFPAGTTTQPITVLVNGDTANELDEAFAVDLANLAGIASVTTQGAGTIVNDEAGPVLSIANISVAEGNSGTTSFVFTITMSGTSASNVSVDVATADGTATAGDYTARTATLTIPAGATTLADTVLVTGDLCGEVNETFTMTLSNPVNATIGTPTATATIQNDDDVTAPSVTVTSPNGGEAAYLAAPYDITWSASDDVDVTSVDILLSRDGGSTWSETLATGLGNTGTYEWTVNGPLAPGTALVKVVAYDAGCNSNSDVSNMAFNIADPALSGVTDGPVTEFALSSLRPNPTAGQTLIQYQLPQASHVRLSIVDLRGRTVSRVIDNEVGPGRHTANWSGHTDTGPAPAGVYFVIFEAGGHRFHKKLVLTH